MIAWSERRTNLRLHEIPAGVISLFPVVIYNEVCNSHVPAALSAQDLACALQFVSQVEVGFAQIGIEFQRLSIARNGLLRAIGLAIADPQKYCPAKRTAAAGFNAVLRATGSCRSIGTHGFL